MKRVIILLIMVLITAQMTYANEKVLCKVPPYPVSGNIARFMSNATGLNALYTKVGESAIQRTLKKELGGKFNVEIYPYGASNLLDGKFKKLTVASKHIKNNDFTITDLYVETLCDYNEITLVDNQVFYPIPMVLNYKFTISSDDINDMVTNSNYLAKINNLSVGAGSTVFFRVVKTEAGIKNNKVTFGYSVIAPLLWGNATKKLQYSTDLNVQSGRIVFNKFDFGNPIANLAFNSFTPILSKMNPLVFNAKLDTNTKAITKVKNVKIENDKILVDGVVIIPKNYRNQKK